MKRILIISTAFILMSCATASLPATMAAEVSPNTLITAESKLSQAVTVGSVEGGKKTNPLWTSQVSSENFAEALRQSLATHAMLASDSGDYVLTAELQKLKQPLAGIDMSVTSSVNYKLTKISTGQVVMNETIEERYTAKFGDSLVAVKRLQLANEGSIKSNITKLIEKMISTVDGGSIPIASIASVKIVG